MQAQEWETRAMKRDRELSSTLNTTALTFESSDKEANVRQCVRAHRNQTSSLHLWIWAKGIALSFPEFS